jgi:hypothetical protein
MIAFLGNRLFEHGLSSTLDEGVSSRVIAFKRGLVKGATPF